MIRFHLSPARLVALPASLVFCLAAACGPAAPPSLSSPGIERHSVYHGGYSGRARANLWFVPESEWGTVIVTNHGRGDDTITADIFQGLLREVGVQADRP